MVMTRESQLADLDEGHNDLFEQFRFRVSEHLEMSQGALIETFEAMLDIASILSEDSQGKRHVRRFMHVFPR